MSEIQHPHFDIVAIGGSAGGLQAARALLGGLPRPFPANIVLCMHRPVHRESHLAAILTKACDLPVVVARHGEVLKPGICYIGDPGMHLAAGPGLVAQSIHDGFYRGHNIDLLFQSLARLAGSRTIGVLLSGLAKDGVEGLRAIKEAGGRALVQNPAEAEFEELPRSALVYGGEIDTVAPVRDLALEIGRLVGCGEDTKRREIA